MASRERKNEIIAWLVWVGLQLAVLLVGLYQIPIVANSPVPTDHLILQGMLVIQLLFGITLSPLLLNRSENLTLACMTSVFFLTLAGLMSSKLIAATAGSCAIILIWLIAIYLLIQIPRLSLQSLLIAMLLLLSLIGPIGFYLELEYGGKIKPLQAILKYLSPTLGSIHVSSNPSQILKVGAFPTLLILTNFFIRHFWKERAKVLQGLT